MFSLQKSFFQVKPVRKSRLRVANGNSLLFGNNYGGYPKRVFYNFSSFRKMHPRSPVAIASCGVDQWHRQVFRKRIKSDTFSVEMVIDGVFNYTLDGKNYQVCPGEIFFVQLGMDSAMCCETEIATKKVIIFDGAQLFQTLEYLELNRIAHLKPQDSGKISGIMDNIIELSKVSSFENFRNACCECYRLLLEISAQNIASTRPAGLQRAIEFIHENLEHPITLNQIVEYSKCSGATLHRQFRKYLNCSPIEYFLNAKMEMAYGMLAGGTLSIKEIASRLNYSSPQYFASEFKKHYGKTPSQIR